MANTHSTLTELFTNIADAIREKKNTTETIIADTFPAEIENLKTGFDYVNQDVTVIPDEAFYGCEDIKSVDCYNLTGIGASAFENCKGLKTVILYDGVQSVGENAFKGCDCIIYCEATSKPETWSENWNPDNCEVVWGFAPVETWDISDTSDDNVTAKLYNDVQNQGYYMLVISGSGAMTDYYSAYITNIPWYNYRKNINFVGLLAGITSIGKHAFYNCDSLKSIFIPDSVTSIDSEAFYGCDNLASVNIGNSVTSIGENVFRDCDSLTSINIPNSVTNIGKYAFSGCNSLTSITIPNSVTNIKDGTFDNCISLESVVIGNSITTIGYKAFGDCTTLKSIRLSDGVVNIDGSAFYSCTSLTSIDIPDSVTRIYNYAFSNCTSLTSINYTGTISQWQSITLGTSWNQNTGNYTIHCTDGKITKGGTITYY